MPHLATSSLLQSLSALLCSATVQLQSTGSVHKNTEGSKNLKVYIYFSSFSRLNHLKNLRAVLAPT